MKLVGLKKKAILPSAKILIYASDVSQCNFQTRGARMQRRGVWEACGGRGVVSRADLQHWPNNTSFFSYNVIITQQLKYSPFHRQHLTITRGHSSQFHLKCNLSSYFDGPTSTPTTEQFGTTSRTPNPQVSAHIRPPWVKIRWWPAGRPARYSIARCLACFQFSPFGAWYSRLFTFFFSASGRESKCTPSSSPKLSSRRRGSTAMGRAGKPRARLRVSLQRARSEVCRWVNLLLCRCRPRKSRLACSRPLMESLESVQPTMEPAWLARDWPWRTRQRCTPGRERWAWSSSDSRSRLAMLLYCLNQSRIYHPNVTSLLSCTSTTPSSFRFSSERAVFRGTRTLLLNACRLSFLLYFQLFLQSSNTWEIVFSFAISTTIDFRSSRSPWKVSVTATQILSELITSLRTACVNSRTSYSLSTRSQSYSGRGSVRKGEVMRQKERVAVSPTVLARVTPAVFTFSAAIHTAPMVMAGTRTMARATFVFVESSGLPFSR